MRKDVIWSSMAGSVLRMCGAFCIGLLILCNSHGIEAQTLSHPSPALAIGGSWIGSVEGPYGTVEFHYEFKLAKNGTLSGAQQANSGDFPILDGRVIGDAIHFTEILGDFGSTAKTEFNGEIEADQIRLTIGSAGPQAASSKSGAPAFPPLVLHRGEPLPSFRAGPLDYRTLPRPVLPALRNLPWNGLAKTPPMGWNSWNRFATAIDDKTVREIAAAIAANGMKDAGFQYIVIDDGWEWKRDSDGAILPNPKFPDMKALTAYVHSLGLKIGIYSSPGPRTCGGYEGSYGHEEQDARTLADWGFDYLKYDWCSARRIYPRAQMQVVYQKMGEALEATHRPIVFALCQYGLDHVEQWGPSVGANLWRTTEDISDSFDSMLQNGLAESDLASFAGPGHWNDPDMLEIGNSGMSSTEYETHLSLWAMLAAPLLAGNDVRTLSADTRKILLNKEVIAVDQDPLGEQGHRVSRSGKTETWIKPLHGSAYAIALFNWSSTAQPLSIRWSDLQLHPKSIRDLWGHRNLKTHGNELSVQVPAHGVVMLRVKN